jgi:hypothetical protein
VRPVLVRHLAGLAINVEVRIPPAQRELVSRPVPAWEALPDYLLPECRRSPQDAPARLRAGPDSVISMGQKKAR